MLKAGRVRMSGTARELGSATSETLPAESAQDDTGEGDIEVTLVRNGDLVEAIRVTCPCGREAEVECLYDALDVDGGGEEPPPPGGKP